MCGLRQGLELGSILFIYLFFFNFDAKIPKLNDDYLIINS
jgi:hypothetical protein